MQDPSELISFETDTPPARMQASVLVVALEGFIDAGQTQKLLADHLLRTHESTVVASFDIDQVLDYRGRRPAMTFDRDRWTSYADPSLLLHRVTDGQGVPFLLLTGPEPDYQWARMVEATMLLVKSLGVRLTVSVHGIPMAVPHTRPMGVTAHATDPRLIPDNQVAFGEMVVPGSFTSLLEYRLGEAGRDAIGFSVHVPHYLGQGEYPEAAVSALDRVAAATGLDLGRSELVASAGLNRAEIDRQVAESDEVAAVVHALEEQYDAFVAGSKRRSLLATELRDLPTADEIGAEFEAFLKDVTDDGGPPDTDTGNP
ncbi:MAG: PAC2 family protein [Intrasporangium sp.]|uniref:proteasome assembly chaperone family protein n=1 Tax=Intrasporangium sp. TaxID=1925024 RepID=UPI002647E355|nr:PAC2 family protein [Intrasporangium sp.]MDN5797352.1 PAC2 family protein [Intrasporangium sp.]